jgi:hypothetical protein
MSRSRKVKIRSRNSGPSRTKYFKVQAMVTRRVGEMGEGTHPYRACLIFGGGGLEQDKLGTGCGYGKSPRRALAAAAKDAASQLLKRTSAFRGLVLSRPLRRS